MKITTRLIMTCLFAVAPAMAAQAAIPGSLSFQAFLSDSSGAPIDQTVSIVFALYASETGGTAEWSDTLSVEVDKGLLSVELGAGSPPFPEDLFAAPLWLGLSVGGDMEMTPRRPISSTAFAFKAADAETLEGNTVEDVLAFAQSGGIPPGARIPILALSLDSQNVDLTGLDMALDGRAVSVMYVGDPVQQPPQWAPLVIEYTYPLNSPSPLGISAGSGALFNNVEILLADDGGYDFRISGSSVVTRAFTSDFIDTGAPASARMPPGAIIVHETVQLEGQFDLAAINAPPNTGPLEVFISEQASSDTFFAKAVGPLTSAFESSGPGQGDPLPFDVVLQGLGADELSLILSDYNTGTLLMSLDLRLSGAPLPSGDGCLISSIEGLSPVVMDDGGVPTDSVQFGQITFRCTGLSGR